MIDPIDLYLGGALVESLVFCLNAILPIFIMIVLGKLLARWGGADKSFMSKLNAFSFKWLIPAMLFLNIYDSDIRTAFDPKLLIFSFSGTVAMFLISWVLSARLLPRGKVASFTQACFRGNYNLMAIPLVTGLLGADMLPKALVMSPVFIALYNVLSVTIFTLYAKDAAKTGLRRVGAVLFGIIKNPFMIAMFLALPFSIFDISLPVLIHKPIEYMSDMATPVALIALGGSLTIKSLKENFPVSLTAAAVKTIITPLIMVPLAIFLGFRGVDLGIIAILFSTPMAVNCYAMAVELGGDGELTSGAILLSTILSVVSLVSTMTLLMHFGLV